MDEKLKGKPGRKAIVFDKEKIEQVEQLSAQGLGPVQISRALGISWDTLNKNRAKNSELSDAIKRGHAKGLAKITSSLFNSAQDGNVTAQIFYLKNKDPQSWSDRATVDHQINIKDLLVNAQDRIIEGQSVEISNEKVQFLEKNSALVEKEQENE